MRGTSAASLDAVRAGFEPVLRAAGVAASELGGQLFQVVDLLTGSGSLRRALADPSRSGEDKAALARAVLASADPRVAAVVAEFARGRWSSEDDLVDGVEEVACDAVLASAQAEGTLEQVEDELFRFDRTLVGERELRRALIDRQAGPEQRAALARRILEGRAQPQTTQLVERAAYGPRGRTMSRMLGRMGRLSARRRELLVASVTAATELSAAQAERLSAVLGRTYGRPVQLAVAVDPHVIGGMRVKVGAQVVDSTVLSRLDEVRRRLAG